MRVFISWSGARSGALGVALKERLPAILPGIETFHSAEIPKGEDWHRALLAALRGCQRGVFCLTPESLRSQWLLFEAGALAQHGDSPKLFTYLYGVAGGNVEGPLGHFQATRFDREDSRRFIERLAADTGIATAGFDAWWAAFEADVLSRMILPIQRLVPEFPELFDRKKTFYESFPDCSNRRWDDRLRRTARVHERLSSPEIADVLASEPYLRGGFDELLSALDRYDMHIGASLMEPREYSSLNENAQRQLEETRTHIVGLVDALQRERNPPVFPESLAFEADPSTDSRKSRIQEFELRLRRGDVPKDRLLTARDSLDWGLDRIAFYVACAAGAFPDVAVTDLILAVRREEEQARTRNLVRGLQPLYYAVECLEERLRPPVDPATAARLSAVVDDVERFLEGDAKRDDGGHIRRRIASLRGTLASPATQT